MSADRASCTKEKDYDCTAGKGRPKQNQAAASSKIESSGAQCSHREREREREEPPTKMMQPDTRTGINDNDNDEEEVGSERLGQVLAEDEISNDSESGSEIESTCTILQREAVHLERQPRGAVSRDDTIDTFDCQSKAKSVCSGEARSDLPERSCAEDEGGHAEQVLCARRLQLQHSRAIETDSSMLDLVENLSVSSSASGDSSSSSAAASSSSKRPEIITSKRNSGNSSPFQNLTSTDEEILVEIDLNQEEGGERRRESVTTIRMLSATTSQRNPAAQINGNQNSSLAGQLSGGSSSRVFANPRPQFGGPNEAPTKICFASKRVKEYFESFRGSGSRGESVRLYQFFKSTRTELVACLLFALISSQALIVSRTSTSGEGQQQWELEEATSYQQKAPLAAQSSTTSFDAAPSALQVRIKRRVANQQQQLIINGLAQAFTVASLTQVFGHISGCHLIPAVSLALYVKGHISRARLGSYLAAQATGSFLGVALLGLLTSSQISPAEYSRLVWSASSNGAQREDSSLLLRRQPSEQSGSSSSRASFSAPAWSLRAARTLKKRAANSGNENVLAAPDGAHINWNDIQGSETILLSIMEQQQRRRREQRDQQVALQDSSSPLASQTDKRAPLEQKTITAQTGTYQAADFLGPRATPAGGLDGGPSNAKAPETFGPPDSVSSQRATWADESRVSGVSGAVVSGSERAERRSELLDSGTVKGGKFLPSAAGSLAPGEGEALVELATAAPPADRWPSVEGNEGKASKPTRRPNKRAKRKPLATKPPDWTAAGESSASSGRQSEQQAVLAATMAAAPDPSGGRYLNLLELALPESIMASESIRQCIEGHQQQQQQQQRKHLPAAPLGSSEAASFGHCLSLSNSSQMFIFQLLATLLIVLVYLVNVDPRRVDLGFKSLSIGLAYFVASVLTLSSGGFFGNPFHLLALSWLAPTGDWQAEWFIYLVTPLVAGLFGAISHEYIDFTSLRNRDKRLHLRRSFYSLENLAAQNNNNSSGSSSSSSAISTQVPPREQQETSTTSATAGEQALFANGFGGAHRELEFRRRQQQQQRRQPCNISETFQQETTREANSSRLQQQAQDQQLFRASCSSIDCALSSCSAELNWQRQQQQDNNTGANVSIAAAGQPMATAQQREQHQRKPQGSLELSARRLAANHLAALRGSNRKRVGMELVNSRKKFVKSYSRLLKLERHKQLEQLPNGGRTGHAPSGSAATPPPPPTTTTNGGRLSASSSPTRARQQQQHATASSEIANGSNLNSGFNYHQVRRLSDLDSNFLISSPSSSLLAPTGRSGRLTTSVGPL